MANSAFDHLEDAPRKRVTVGKKRVDAPNERVVQRTIIKAIRKLGLRVVHIPNGAHLAGTPMQRARQANAMKADGMMPGCPDLLVIRPKRYGGPAIGWLEVKAEGGTLSEAQDRFGDTATLDGFPWAAVCTLDGALDALRAWGWL